MNKYAAKSTIACVLHTARNRHAAFPITSTNHTKTREQPQLADTAKSNPLKTPNHVNHPQCIKTTKQTAKHIH